MDPRGIFWTGARTRRSGMSWVVPLALVAFWIAVTAFTLWELATVGPTLRQLARTVTRADQRELLVWERPNPLLF